MTEPEGASRYVPVRAEIISVGTELLLGTISDTNAAYLAQRLADLGIDCFYISAVGDNLGRLSETIERAFGRSDIVIGTGGLGPTGDDLTREAVAAVLGEELQVAPELEGPLRAFFERRGLQMPERNIKQATLIPSARVISNPVGTAPGWWVETYFAGSTRTGIFMPGVPFEMKRMWEQEVEPTLRGRSGMVLISRTLKILGAGESAVEAMVADLMEGANPTLAPYAKSDGIHLRLAAKAESKGKALELISVLEELVRERLGDLIYGTDSDTPEGAADAAAVALSLKYAVMEIGLGTDSALLDRLNGQAGFVGGRSASTPEEATARPGATSEADIRAAAQQLAEFHSADIVLAVISDLTPVEGDDTIISASVEARVYSRTGEVLVAQRQSWQVPPGEVPRVARLMALNLLRRKLMAMRREGAERSAR